MHIITDVKKLTDIELLELLCSSEDDEIPYTQFVNRFLKPLQKECDGVCKKRKLDLHIGREIANKSFERLRKYKSFKADQISTSNHNKAILAYLCRISTRLFNDYHKNQKNDFTVQKTYFDDILDSVGTAETNPKVLQNKKELAVLIFNKLNPKEKRIILADIEYKRHHKYLPDNVIDSLAEELNIKKDTVRKIRERAILKIKNAIHEINNQ